MARQTLAPEPGGRGPRCPKPEPVERGPRCPKPVSGHLLMGVARGEESPGGCLPARVREPYSTLGCANSRVGNGRSSINLSALDMPVAKILGLVLSGLANGQVAG